VLETDRAPVHRQTPMERAADAAEPGIWECLLPFETLTWSDAVYDLFEVPRGFRLTREETIGFYTNESRQMLEDVRTRAIQNCTGFTLDAEIITALGKPRWIRIVANVEYENGAPVRLFGTKQDITGEKGALARLSESPGEPSQGAARASRHPPGSA
jgi:PAS domain-containing protein